MKVIRTITMTYPDRATYEEDRRLWRIKYDEADGMFNRKKRWTHEVVEIEEDETDG